MRFPLVALVSYGCSQPAPPEQDGLGGVLEEIRAEAGIPALAMAVVEGGEISDIAATGFRRLGRDALVTIDDPWHLGSDTKAMTATLLGVLVEDGVLSWELTLAEAFPALDPVLDSGIRDVTLQQLVTNRGGMPEVPPDALWSPLFEPGDVVAQRAAFVDALLRLPPETSPGTFAYSNAGFMVLGAAMEAATGTAWEDLMTERIFEPLGMTGCGFGPPALDRAAPWGHVDGVFGLDPVDPSDPGADNPPAMGPAGTVFCPLQDWARFTSAHVAGARGDETFLSAGSWEQLHTPPAEDGYAGGWIAVDQDWGGGTVLTHTGSNTMFAAVAWLAPEIDTSWLVVTNAGTEAAITAMDEAVASQLDL